VEGIAAANSLESVGGLLDTDTYIGVLRQKPGMVQRLSQLPPADVAVFLLSAFPISVFPVALHGRSAIRIVFGSASEW